MRTMPDIKYLIILLTILSAALSGQTTEQLFDLYEQKNTKELKQIVNSIQDDTPDIKFFRYLFVENGDEAVRLYEALYPETGGRIKNMVARKIAEYYYAKGYYVKADEYFAYSKIAAAQSAPVRIPSKLYHIQVGAFGFSDNAERMKDLLQTRNITATVHQREINGKALFCVWIAGKEDLDQTRELAETLKKAHKLSYQIINP